MRRSHVVFLIENTAFLRDRRVRQEAAALLQHGCSVSVVCPGGRVRDEPSFQIVDQIRVHQYWQPWQGKHICGYVLEYSWALVWTILIVCGIWTKEGFDVLHAANPPDLLWIVALPFKLIGKKFVYDQHDLCPELLESRLGDGSALRSLFLLMERCSYSLANLVIVTNQSAHEIALARGASPERTVVVRNGPDLDYFVKVEANPELRRGARYLALYVGTMAPQDGVERILRAVHHIVYDRGRTDVHFALVGNGECLADLQTLASALRVESYVTFCGWLDDPALFTYLSTADVCLAPEPPLEFNQRSSFIKLTEYMCYGKATVSFDLLESRRTLGDSGVFVEQDDLSKFGDGILSILDAPEIRAKKGQIASKRLRENFHWGLYSQALLAAYQKEIWDGRPIGNRNVRGCCN
jgi:glycosyltransferase involved in cell wall biosynthesis